MKLKSVRAFLFWLHIDIENLINVRKKFECDLQSKLKRKATET